MSDDITDATIAMLQRGIKEAEKEAEEKIRSLRAAINTICTQAGRPQLYADALVVPGSGRIAQIQDDTFYGKKQTPAMREYLEMRKAQDMGPATPREIYEALKSGGYQFETKDETVALVGLRALLRTQPNIFHKLPQGTYGLTSWYPDAKRQTDDAARRRRKKGSAKKKRAKRTRTEATADNVVDLKAEAGKAA